MSQLNRIIVGLLLTVLLPINANSTNIDEANVLYDKAVDAIKAGKDSSVRDSLLSAALELDPESPQINWQILWSSSWAIRGEGRLASRAQRLAELAESIDKVKALAKKRGDMALYHHIQARYYAAYNQFDKALEEIDKTLLIEPKSTRFLFAKADILADKGLWNTDEIDVWTVKGNQILEYILSADLIPSKQITKYDIYFRLAYNEAKLKKGNHEKTVNYYLKSLENDVVENQDRFIWNNMSIAYFKMEHCQKAFDAAKKAIDESMQRSKRKGYKYNGFRAAESNLRIANYCLKMQKMGVL